MSARLHHVGRALPALAGLAMVGALLALGLGLGREAPAVATGAAAERGALRSVSPAEIPLRFVPNAGQSDPRVRFVAHGPRRALFFTPEAVVLVSMDAAPPAPGETRPVSLRAERRGEALALAFVGADPDVRIEGRRELRGRAHYAIGRDREAWRSELPTYGEVVYRELWPGIDMVFRPAHGRLKYELVVAPGARPEAIRLAYRGVDRVELDGAGDLRLTTARGVRREPRPVSYQDIGGRRVPVESAFAMPEPSGAGAEVGFAVGAYDPRHPLVIDPALVYSTFLGGSANDVALGAAVDAAGHIYVAGFTVSPNFPTSLGAFAEDKAPNADAFVAKIDPFEDGDDSLIYSTFIGGDGADEATAIAVDGAGHAFVTGFTQAFDFPVTDGSGSTGAALDDHHDGAFDAFLVKLSPSGGALRYSSYVGGQWDELGTGIALRASGGSQEVYLTGSTDSPDFPGAGLAAINGLNAGTPDPVYVDAYVVKFVIDAAHQATFEWATFVGGTVDDSGFGIAVDDAGHAIVVGDTNSTDFPATPANAFDTTHNGGLDAFVAKLDTDGSCCLYATYLGGPGADQALAVALDAGGHAYVAGRAAAGFPTSAGAFDTTHNGGVDAFAARIDTEAAGAASRVYATYLGGAGNERGRAIAVVRATGLAFVAGETSSANFPATPGAISDELGGNDDAFLVSVHPSGDSVLWGTYLGAQSFDTAFAVAIQPNNADNVALAGAAQTGFPTTSGAFQENYGGATDAFVARIRVAPQLCLGNLVRDTRRVFLPRGCLTCPPDPLTSRILVAQLDVVRDLVERGNLRAATATLTAFRQEVAALGRIGRLPAAPARNLGLTAAQCNRIFTPLPAGERAG